jgi:hypothetical protein
MEALLSLLFVYWIPAQAKGISFRGLIRAGHKHGLTLPQAFHRLFFPPKAQVE